MHEMSLAEAILEIVREEMSKHSAKGLRSVKVCAGVLSMVVPESLKFCFEVLIDGTELQGAELIIEEVPLKAYCKDCLGNFSSKSYLFECPTCGGSDIEITDGQGLYVAEMEIE